MLQLLKPVQIGLASCALLSPFTVVSGNGEEPDSVMLKNGGEKTGRIIFEDEEHLVLRQGSHELEIDRAKIESVESLERSLAYLLKHHLVVKDSDVRSLADSSKLAKERGLPGIADLFNLMVLLADPENEKAHEALGHRRRSREWTAQLDGKWYLWRELIELRRDWNYAWQFETAHYSLRTNLPLKEAIQSLLDLESYYLFFHETLGSPIGMRGVAKPLKVNIFGDEKSYVQLGDNRPGWYDTNSRTVNVNGTNPYRRLSFMHEATHQLFEVESNGLLGANSRAPAWLGEGMAEYLANSAEGAPGRARFSAGRFANGHLYNHSKANKPESLDEILSLSVADFLSSKPAPLRYAQSYTLVLYCMHGEGERYRADFIEFCQRAIEGKGSPTNFKKLVTKNSKEFEKGWTAYVSNLTGGR